MKIIKLSTGQETLVDDADYKWLIQWNWGAIKNKARQFYVLRSVSQEGKPKNIYLHRLLLGLNSRQVGEHQDRNSLNNQRHNLRPASRSQNGANTIKYRCNKSGFKGVFKSSRHAWKAQIRVRSKTIYLGSFPTAYLAAMVYDRAARRYFGKFARLNLP